MNSLRTQPQLILRAAAAALLYAAVSSAQVPAATRPLALNGSAKLLTLPDGSSALWLTPAQEYQAGSAFTSSPVAFNAN